MMRMVKNVLVNCGWEKMIWDVQGKVTGLGWGWPNENTNWLQIQTEMKMTREVTSLVPSCQSFITESSRCHLFIGTMRSRVCVTVRCPSDRLSVPRGGFAAGSHGGRKYRSTAAGGGRPEATGRQRRLSNAHSSTAVGSKCEQCHAYSRRRRLNTDLFHNHLRTV